MNDGYHLVPEFSVPKTYVSLRSAAEMPPWSLVTTERGIPNTTFGVRVIFEGAADDEIVGMGRLVGDGGTVFQVVDIAAHPGHQDYRLGIRVIDTLMDYLDRKAPPSAFVSLLVDMDSYYKRWGFEPTALMSKGIFLRMDEGDVHKRDEN